MTVSEHEYIAYKVIEDIAGLTALQYERFKRLVRKKAPDLIKKYPWLINLMDEIRQL